ncbi:MAG TPA: hypothetical protein VGJ26_15150, partial [Pirellulales bacterium]
MSIATSAALYQEQVRQTTSRETIDRCLEDLAGAKESWRETPLSRRIELARACLAGTVALADRWVAEACRAKGIEPGTPLESEETAAGPMATARYLTLLIRSLEDVERTGQPRLPGSVKTLPNGQLAVQVFPTRGLYDSVLFAGFRADVWMQPGVTRENLPQHMAQTVKPGAIEVGIALVLGAGNVSSIAPTDAFTKLFQEGKVVLLKM